LLTGNYWKGSLSNNIAVSSTRKLDDGLMHALDIEKACQMTWTDGLAQARHLISRGFVPMDNQ
jgi:hypothetical protein